MVGQTIRYTIHVIIIEHLNDSDKQFLLVPTIRFIIYSNSNSNVDLKGKRHNTVNKNLFRKRRQKIFAIIVEMINIIN